MSITDGTYAGGIGAQITKDVERDKASREEWREISGIAKHLDLAALERASSQQRRAAEAYKQEQQHAWALADVAAQQTQAHTIKVAEDWKDVNQGPWEHLKVPFVQKEEITAKNVMSESYMYGVGQVSPQGPRNWFPVLPPSEAYVKGLEQQVLEGLGRIKLLETRLVAAESPGSHDYVGPTAPDSSGRQVSIPDAAHENFHKAVGDVLAGKIMQGARRQMQEALKGISKDPAPFPTAADHSDPRRIGWRVPS